MKSALKGLKNKKKIYIYIYKKGAVQMAIVKHIAKHVHSWSAEWFD